ncbi:MAG TPA: tRNA (adenosine(37)-N6)-dimethylallyltransferase MiaA [bacterium]|nr:tRNA (adenosine(37)-N6)-dimethylallyltransferase MiaA [bacterium]
MLKKDKTKKIIKSKVLVILGPTASGKTSLAVKLADKFGGEIISADSRQVYRGMDIGTGKDLADYNYQGKDIPYYLIDVADPKSIFSLAKYQELALKAIDSILNKKKIPFLVGGSGLYLQAVVDNYLLTKVKPVFNIRDEYEKLSLNELQNQIKKINLKFFQGLNNSEINNKRRLARYLEVLGSNNDFSPKKGEIKYDFLILGLNPAREIIKEKIYQRLISRLENENMIGEVERLYQQGISFTRLESFGLEYKFIARYLQKKISYQQLVSGLFIAICQFSKRQMSWFRRWEKQGIKINWINDYSEAEKSIKKWLKD